MTSSDVFSSQSIATSAHRRFVLVAAVGLVAFTLWAGFTTLDKVTRGEGRVVPQSDNQIIDHLEGGIVSEILVRNGDIVQEGQVLMRVDNALSESELGRARIENDALLVRRMRLLAETRGDASFGLPENLSTNVSTIVANERSLFDLRRAQLREKLTVLEEQVKQKELALAELQSRWSYTTREREIVLEQAQSLRKLAKQGAVSRNELLSVERDLQQLETRLGGLTHEIPSAEAALSETQARRREAVSQFAAEAEKERGEVDIALSKLEQSMRGLKERESRTEVVSPISGIVKNLYITTIGGVVKSGAPLIELVPAGASIAIEMKLSPADRADIYPGQRAVVKISAYEYALYGGLQGKVIDISPDALKDDQGRSFFRVRLEADGSSLGNDRPVVPGMLAEVDVLTGEHTILSYVTKPLTNLRDKALRQ
jgi:HlyD family type I secretion membrane fusion protein